MSPKVGERANEQHPHGLCRGDATSYAIERAIVTVVSGAPLGAESCS